MDRQGVSMLTMALLLGCGNEVADCRVGFEAEDDGLCYELADTDLDTDAEEPADPTVEDLLAALPACDPGATDGRIDVQSGCADGACAGMTLPEVEDALGEEGYCQSIAVDFDSFAYAYVSCSWSVGIGASFDDDDGDGLADPTAETFAIYVDLPYEGGTADGLGLGANAACFVDALGAPGSVRFALDGGEWLATSLSWSEIGVYDDYVNKNGDFGPDGRIDGITLYGSP